MAPTTVTVVRIREPRSACNALTVPANPVFLVLRQCCSVHHRGTPGRHSYRGPSSGCSRLRCSMSDTPSSRCARQKPVRTIRSSSSVKRIQIIYPAVATCTFPWPSQRIAECRAMATGCCNLAATRDNRWCAVQPVPLCHAGASRGDRASLAILRPSPRFTAKMYALRLWYSTSGA